MSGKYSKKPKRWPMAVALVLVLAALCAVVVWLLAGPRDLLPQPTVPTDALQDTPSTAGSSVPEVSETAGQTKPVHVDEVKPTDIDLGNGLYITDVGKYTGVYMEDGSDEMVSGILMIAVTNRGENAVQYARITMPLGDQTAQFVLSTLPVGGTVILLEQTRMAYVPGEYIEAAADNVALFSGPLSLCQDRLEIQILDGAINITNVSGADIIGDIVIYYKNTAADVYYGGITYRVRLEGGMKADEVRQIVASHFSAVGSTIMFVTCGDS